MSASSADAPLRVGVMGTGDIVGGYLDTLRRLSALRVTAIAGRDPGRTRAAAERWGVARALTPEELAASAEVDLALVLSEPAAHAEQARLALEGGKHVYCEKPLAASTAEAAPLLALARARGLTLAGAPDTFLGSAQQAARAALDAGAIGRPVGALAFGGTPGMEDWHPRPAGFYRRGSGPLLDIGPYPITHLIALLGPVTRVTGMAARGEAERVAPAGPAAGTRFPVEVDTHVTALLAFASGAVATLVTSVEVRGSDAPPLEIYGTTGALSLTSMGYGGEARVRGAGEQGWRAVGGPAGAGGAAAGRCGPRPMRTRPPRPRTTSPSATAWGWPIRRWPSPRGEPRAPTRRWRCTRSR